jgi:SNF2 family DNA or RNA helicase
LLLSLGKEVPRPHIFAVITKLKQVCDHPALVNSVRNPLLGRSEKFDLVVEKIKNITDGGEGVAVFSQFLGALDLLEESMNEGSIDYIRIDGSTRDRQGLIDYFNSGKANVALLSLRAAGHGITLTAANHVIHLDRWWNPAIEDQATDRVHRIGQMKTVYVHKILNLGTLEERIDSLIEEKRKISGKVIPGALDEIQWTREELLEILKPLEDAWVP